MAHTLKVVAAEALTKGALVRLLRRGGHYVARKISGFGEGVPSVWVTTEAASKGRLVVVRRGNKRKS